MRAWHRLTRGKKRRVDGEPAPDRYDEYLLYQTLVGAWPMESLAPGGDPIFTERIQAYMLKALREAKVHASWISPHPEYEAAMHGFVAALLDPDPANAFLAGFVPFQRRVATWAVYNALAQTLLTAPGVADLYQGTELWDLSLVDPDNRRPVDFARRQALLDHVIAEIEAASPDLAALAGALLARNEDGRVKL